MLNSDCDSLTGVKALLLLGQLGVSDDLLLSLDLTEAYFTFGQTILVVKTPEDSGAEETPSAKL